ncbi:MAG: ribulose-phosphate 3-epimerase [Clostridia bacterium]|nr:ribulose-phosphate 3-epimerase [Clostridia bacterium]
MTISASVLGADLLRLGDEVEKTRRLGLRWLHLDQMDGHFVPNISFGPEFVAALRGATDQFLDVHLMLEHPLSYIDAYADAGADLISIHAEAQDNPAEALAAIRARGLKAGLSIKPATDPESIRALLPLCDLVLVMTVEPGFGGQKLMDGCVAKLPVLRKMIEETGRDILLEADGGIKLENAERVIAAGADVAVIGTGLFRAEDPERVVREVEGAAACAL